MNRDGKLIADHIGHLRMLGRADTTIKSRLGALNRARHAMAVALSEATETDLLQWRAGLTALSDMTVICEVSHLRGFYAWAAEFGHLEHDPCRRIPVPPVPEYVPRPIAAAALLSAVDNAPGRMRIWLVLAAWCGMRSVEIAQLRRSCVREADQAPHIVIRPDATKGRRHGRVISLCAFAAAELGGAGLPVAGWCFPRLDGQPGPVSPHRVSNAANAYLHGLGIADTFHSLRHFFGTALLEGTGNLRVVQDQLGHLNIQTTTRYTKVSGMQAAAAVATLPDPRRLRRVS